MKDFNSIANKHISVFWMPRTHLKPVEPLSSEEIKSLNLTLIKEGKSVDHLPIIMENGDMVITNFNISDKSVCPLFLDITLKKPQDESKPLNRSIEVKGKLTVKSDPKWTLLLNCDDTDPNGLIKYSYHKDSDIDSLNALLNNKGNIIHAVYHAIKFFYHVHEFHDEHDDSILEAYYCNNKENEEIDIDIHAKDNKAITFYLSSFEKMFDDFKDVFIHTNNKIKGFYSIPESNNRAFDAAESLFKECSNAIGIYEYVKLLQLCSDNQSYKDTISNFIETIKNIQSDNRKIIDNIKYKLYSRPANDELGPIAKLVILTRRSTINTILISVFGFAITIFFGIVTANKKDIFKIENRHNQTDSLLINNTKEILDSIELIPHTTKSIFMSDSISIK